MLRLAEPLISSRFGGWALVESPPRRLADGGQHWSLLIVTAAALVAMFAVVFDIGFSPGLDASLVSPSTAAVETAAATTTPQRTVASPSAPAGDTTRAERSTTAETAAASPTERVRESGSSATTQPTESAQAARGDLETTRSATAAAQQPAEAAESGEVASAAINDPASRIREYLGLHAGAQLPVSFSYEVQTGDTASSIAERFGLQEATVLFNNFDIYDANHLVVGQQVKLPPVDGLVYVVQPGDTLDALIENFQASMDATLSYPANGIASPDQIQVGQRLLLVHGSASVATPVASGSSGGPAAATWTEPTFMWPLGFDEISDPFGTYRPNSFGYHTGVDFVAAVGTIVGSTAAGQVTVATWDPSYGNWVEIDHGGGFRSRYAHLNEIFVREGEWVDANTFIGTVGNTGNSSGAHLHFEIIVNGQAVNPLAWLN